MKQSTKPKPTSAELAALQAAKDLWWNSGMLSVEQNHRMQAKLDNLKSGTNRGQWGMRFKGEAK